MPYFYVSYTGGKVIKKATNLKSAVDKLDDDLVNVSIAEVDTAEHNVCLKCDDVLNKAHNFCPKCNAEVKQLK